MALPWILAVAALALSVALGFRLALARADVRLITEARDALARDNSALTVRVAALERENQAWAQGATIRRRGVAPSAGG